MPKLTIDDREVEVAEGSTLIQAARKLDIEIPALCYREGTPFFTSCMVCVVKDLRSGRMLPACSAKAVEGMEIQTESDPVREARKDTLELLLSEHVGNCEGPCTRACPAQVKIPWINSCVEEGKTDEAIAHLNEQLIFPSLVERACKAPCEQVCRRDEYDTTVAIRQLALHIADQEMQAGFPSLPLPEAPCGKSVAIVGAGATGLAAAYKLLLQGYACTIYDESTEPGGDLRRHIPEHRLPREVIDAELGKLNTLGAVFILQTRIDGDRGIAELLDTHDALVLAVGKVKPETPAAYGLEAGSFGIHTNEGTFQTSNPRIFTGGDAMRPFRSVARSIADGRGIARSVHQFLSGEALVPKPRRFNSRVGHLQPNELERFVAGYDRQDQVVPEQGKQAGYSKEEALTEAGRCLHCECLKPDTCKLRIFSERYGAVQDRYLQRIRGSYRRVLQHADVIFEPGKCIKCGLCIRIAEQHGEPLGLTFVDRGFDVHVAVPLNKSMTEALGKVADEVVAACPTAALSFKSQQLRKMPETQEQADA